MLGAVSQAGHDLRVKSKFDSDCTNKDPQFLTLRSQSFRVVTMNTESTPQPSSIEASATQAEEQKASATLDDDLDFSDVQLAPRQKSATQEIVCEGGCE